MVRLVFRPYTQIRRTICTSVSLRASTRVSPGFTLLRYSSPSFGSQQVCLHSNLSPKIEVGCYYKNYNCHFHYAHTVSRHVLAHVCGLLGPCFKTGHLKPFGTDAADHACLTAQPTLRSTHEQSLRARDTMQEYAATQKNKIHIRHKPAGALREFSEPGVWLTL